MVREEMAPKPEGILGNEIVEQSNTIICTYGNRCARIEASDRPPRIWQPIETYKIKDRPVLNFFVTPETRQGRP